LRNNKICTKTSEYEKIVHSVSSYTKHAESTIYTKYEKRIFEFRVGSFFIIPHILV